MILRNAYIEYFSSLIFRVQFGVISGEFCTIFDVKILKTLLLPYF